MLIFFVQPLRGENCLLVPPVSIVSRVLHYMKWQNAAGTLVVPFWPSAHYWPLIMHKYGDYIVAHAICAGKEVLTSIHRLYYSHKDGIYRVINWASSCWHG